ncbi:MULTISPECIES: hypothetical protein [unclassified Neorhizobium]|uniref:hypothetical protein n=1 Tax=unclassified Neorhizobium TaxID=2629175 RepID=UPI001FF19C99|nr:MULTISPECIES: hypothetical protein [unclassified Neorhizobium]MCJ9669026.1 hypothetical protein [Neorhizobium sp. SHOUNA12B]MCJ9744980.1 hypothetical protein [Neorhizobium sp. SHOUNA12A]
MIAIEGGIIFSKFEQRFFNLGRLRQLAGSDELFEEIWLTVRMRIQSGRRSRPSSRIIAHRVE